jgi:hypothetical protein
MWDEIVNADFFDDGRDLPTSPREDGDLVILPTAHQKPSSPPCRTAWESLTERLANASFEARFVNVKQREANEASIKRRYGWDPQSVTHGPADVAVTRSSATSISTCIRKA